MAAYVIAYLKLHDTAFLEDYGPKSDALIAKHGGEAVVMGQPSMLEGKEPNDDLVVVLKFPDKAAALAWHNDPEYAPLLATRNKYATTVATVVEAAEA